MQRTPTPVPQSPIPKTKHSGGSKRPKTPLFKGNKVIQSRSPVPADTSISYVLGNSNSINNKNSFEVSFSGKSVFNQEDSEVCQENLSNNDILFDDETSTANIALETKAKTPGKKTEVMNLSKHKRLDFNAPYPYTPLVVKHRLEVFTDIEAKAAEPDFPEPTKSSKLELLPGTPTASKLPGAFPKISSEKSVSFSSLKRTISTPEVEENTEIMKEDELEEMASLSATTKVEKKVLFAVQDPSSPPNLPSSGMNQLPQTQPSPFSGLRNNDDASSSKFLDGESEFLIPDSSSTEISNNSLHLGSTNDCVFSSSTTKSPLKSLGLINSDEDELSGINIDASTSFDISNANQDTSFNLIEFDCKRATEEEFVIETQTEDEQADPGFGQFSNSSPVKDDQAKNSPGYFGKEIKIESESVEATSLNLLDETSNQNKNADDSLNLIELGSKMVDDDFVIEKVDSYTQVDPCIDEKNDKMKKKVSELKVANSFAEEELSLNHKFLEQKEALLLDYQDKYDNLINGRDSIFISLKNELEIQKHHNSVTTQEVSLLKLSCKALEAKNNDLSSKLKVVTNLHESTEKLLANSKEAESKCKLDLQRSLDHASHLKRQNEALILDLEELKIEKTKWQDDCFDAQKKNINLEESVANLQEARDLLEIKVETLKNSLAESEKKFCELNNRTEEQLDLLQQTLTLKELENTDLSNKVEDLKEKLASNTAELESMDGKLQDLRSSLGANDLELIEMEATTSDEISSLKNKYDQLSKQHDQTSKELEDYQHTCMLQDEKLASFKERCKRLEETCETLVAKNKDDEESYNVLWKKNSADLEMCMSLNEENGQLREELIEKEKQIMEYQLKNDEIRNSNDASLKNSLINEEEISSLKTKLTDFTNKYQAAMQIKKDLEYKLENSLERERMLTYDNKKFKEDYQKLLLQSQQSCKEQVMFEQSSDKEQVEKLQQDIATIKKKLESSLLENIKWRKTHLINKDNLANYTAKVNAELAARDDRASRIETLFLDILRQSFKVLEFLKDCEDGVYTGGPINEHVKFWSKFMHSNLDRVSNKQADFWKED